MTGKYVNEDEKFPVIKHQQSQSLPTIDVQDSKKW